MKYDSKKGMVALRSDIFGDRVTFAGNLEKNDLAITLSDVQLEDEGLYNCYVRNPPDRIQGHGVIELLVVTERKKLTLLSKNINTKCIQTLTLLFDTLTLL